MPELNTSSLPSSHALHGGAELARLGQHDDAEVVGLGPVEAGAGDDQDFRLGQQIPGELLVVCDVEFLHIQLGEQIEGGNVLDIADALDLVQGLDGGLALLVEPSAGANHGGGGLHILQRRGNDELRQGVGAQPG